MFFEKFLNHLKMTKQIEDVNADNFSYSVTSKSCQDLIHPLLDESRITMLGKKVLKV